MDAAFEAFEWNLHYIPFPIIDGEQLDHDLSSEEKYP